MNSRYEWNFFFFFFIYISEHTPNSFHVDNALNASLTNNKYVFRDLPRVASSKSIHYALANGTINRGKRPGVSLGVSFVERETDNFNVPI